MAFLEAAGAGAYVSGIDGGSAAVRVISAVRRGPDAAAVTYRNVDERT